jgi:hypothetical protein
MDAESCEHEKWLRARAAKTIGKAHFDLLACADELARLRQSLAMATDAANKGDEARGLATGMQGRILELEAENARLRQENERLRGALSIIKAGIPGPALFATDVLAHPPEPETQTP